MHTLFIADVHLCTDQPDITKNFLNFLRNKAVNANALYILGDLFESWIGDDAINSMHLKVAAELKQLNNRSIPCYFIHGNRDFLLGRNYAKISGIKLLNEPQILEISGHRIIILHGDSLCNNDKRYQNFKKKIRQIWLQKLFLLMPLSIRIYITKIIRNRSILNHTHTSKTTDLDLQKILSLLLKYQATILIHGHTHNPAIYKMYYKSKIFYHVNLGMWNNSGSIVELNKFGLSLIKY
ncbi:UDP-2,3-diacylglucosamine diphosphatase [Blochmannia endosymbiont of Colobopsis nipponica]|uniref:UDP-2,3-diacylglucosamine diphosphatase n=1 Tax=Blochmannia endosymbiont of Colobopsis nipponica TaxID=2681987 RepID=UPI00178215B5|nr:UDP-2,3-diacylglucosamine diphosphatase [Blochmannia endosymbiont of Colobopsis nipponica]QOI11135.1 UDP-2,3-diacylglucosamine diphosphatase [Blochmannia endosymbiont of Colobopsis nipponica]